MTDYEPEAELNWRGLTLEIEAWFPRGIVDTDIKKWCDENMSCGTLVVKTVVAQGINKPGKYSFHYKDISYRYHIKLGNPTEEDLVLFKLTWL